MPNLPMGYLITMPLAAWCTLFALAPPRPARPSTGPWGRAWGPGGAPRSTPTSPPGCAATWAGILGRPFPVRPRQVERVANLAHGDAGRQNLLDLYRHRAHPAGAPTLVYLHGGAFPSGGKHDARPPTPGP